MHTRDPEDWPRIIDLSVLEPEDFKYRNEQFLTDEAQPYETGMDKPQQELREEIWRVRNGDIQRVLDRFPTDKPLREQCALWMHAVVGKHFFPDANHRTAMALLRELLQENRIDYERWSVERLRTARKESHEIRRKIEPVHLDTLYRRDPLYEVWLSFFEDELVVVDPDSDET